MKVQIKTTRRYQPETLLYVKILSMAEQLGPCDAGMTVKCYSHQGK